MCRHPAARFDPGGRWLLGGDVADTTEALSLQTFAPGPTMLTARCECATFALPQDRSPRRALVVGGRYDGFSHLATTEVLTAAS